MTRLADEWTHELKTHLIRDNESLIAFLTVLHRFDAVRAWEELGYSSLWTFCELGLDLTCQQIAPRMRLLRVCQRIPRAWDALQNKHLTPTALRLLAPLLSEDNFESWLAQVQGLSTRRIEALVQGVTAPTTGASRDSIRPIRGVDSQTGEPAKPQVGSVVPRRESPPIPQATPEGFATQSTALLSSNEGHQTPTEPPPETTPEAYRLGVTVSKELYDKLQRVKEIASHRCDPRSLESVLEMMIDCFLKKHDPALPRGAAETQSQPKKLSTPIEKPQQKSTTPSCADADRDNDNSNTTRVVLSRTVPAQVRRHVWQRDGGQCTYVDPATGHRCACRERIQVDHIKPFAQGGSSTDPDNLRLLCQTHNLFAARKSFGDAHMNVAIQTTKAKRRSSQMSPPTLRVLADRTSCLIPVLTKSLDI